MNDTFDVVVLGAGNAGLAAAGVARKAGRSVAVVEARELGGTCPLRGCVPKKVLVAATEVLEAIDRGAGLGIHARDLDVDWSRVIDRQRSILEGTSESIATGLERDGIELVRGHARFVAPDAISVGDRDIRFDRALIATGSRPRPLQFSGADLLTSSDELLELRSPPRSLFFIGAGVIAFELGQIFARLGASVTFLEVGPRPLGPLDGEAVGELVKATQALGIEVITNVSVDRVVRDTDGFSIEYQVKGEHNVRAAEFVAHGAGRVAWLDGLDLELAGVETQRGGVVCDRAFQSSSNARVFVAGDALAETPQLSPVATYEGRLAGRALVGEDVAADYRSIPSCVFSLPTLAQVGLTEEAAAAKGLSVRVVRNDMTGWRSGRSYGERFAWAKVLLDSDDLIVGAHLFGHGAAETINTLALAMRHRIQASALRDGIWAYPTFGSDLKHLV